MVYVDRTHTPVIRLKVGDDNGRAWSTETELDIYRPELASQMGEKRSVQDAWNEMSAFSCGLPATAKALNGDILVCIIPAL